MLEANKQIDPKGSTKSKLLEVERKYKSSKKEWEDFILLCRSMNPTQEKLVGGPDTYYINNENTVLRWRAGSDVSELTIKSRYKLSSSLVRREVEINLADNNPKTIIKLIDLMGFRKLFRIRKTCHIFLFDYEGSSMCVVIYKVENKNQKDNYFIELEPEKGLPVEEAKKFIREWEKKLGLKTFKRLNETLYEIYSGNTTKLVEINGVP
jgi:adenylate cyclase class IV